ncbi:sirohydrochlorin ferrochelatase, chloroplastic-like [Vicia villosa]|uniref:sirohydrochlorin ferrochelatase, chloroplastic-like n=1 Tax=Vicia villosa TaxID=3911 RepID=UPI00273CAA61|nr:sirohydrochlorin ferrochelatase, chloroplastic-like [Vicia villosa]
MKILLGHTKIVLVFLFFLISFSASEIETNQRSDSLIFLSNSFKIGPSDAVIIVDHGSNREESNIMLNEFVEMFRHKTGYKIVEPAHMELAKPSIEDAFRSCVQQGARRVIISLFFLGSGKHFNEDIPFLSAEAAKQHPGVSYIITPPLGLHELLVDIVNDRINSCLKPIGQDADECSVCDGTGKCILPIEAERKKNF